MFFTRIATACAWLTFAFGCMQLPLGVGVAFGFVVEPEPGRYLGSKTSEQAIDAAITIVLVAIALGTVAEISRKLKRDS